MLVHLDLFSGIGGFTLACQWAGIETIGFVEIDKYCQKVLRKHFPGVPIVEDIRDVEKVKEIVANATELHEYASNNKRAKSKAQISEPRDCDSQRDIPATNRDGKSESPAILITAGFPCQPFSVAGKRQGETDDRYLWPETLAVIKAIKPKWILLENVTGIINLALDTVLSDLEGAGYSYETLIVPACAVNAWHRRDRIWVIAYCSKQRLHREEDECIMGSTGSNKFLSLQSRNTDDVAISKSRESREQTEPEGREGSGRGSQEIPVADTTISRLENPKSRGESASNGETCNTPKRSNWWAVEPELGRVAHGIPNRVDRLKCLGNAIVPQVAYEIIKAILWQEYDSI